MVGRNPFEGITPATIDEIKTRPVLIEKKALYPNTRDLIKKLMAQNPQDRLGARNSLEIFGHEFFKENEDLMLGIFRHERSVLKHLRFAMPEKLQPRQELEKL